MSKAFDKVRHEGLIFKNKQNGVAGKVQSLVENYRSHRAQRVALNGLEFDQCEIESGVKKGSVT